MTPIHFVFLLESSWPGLCQEIESFHYGKADDCQACESAPWPAAGLKETHAPKGEIRLLYISAFETGPKDFFYLHLPCDISGGELLCFKEEGEAISYFSTQKQLFQTRFKG